MASSRSIEIGGLRQLFESVDEINDALDVFTLMNSEEVAKSVFRIIDNDDDGFVDIADDKNDDKNPERINTNFVDEHQFWLLWSEGQILEQKLDVIEDTMRFESTFDAVVALVQAFNPRRVSEKSSAIVHVMHGRLKQIKDGQVTLPMLKSLWPTNESRWLVDRFFCLMHRHWPSVASTPASTACVACDSICVVLFSLLGQTDSSKVFFLFGLFDTDQNGTLEESELRTVLVHMMSENGVIFDQEQLELLVDVLVQESLDVHLEEELQRHEIRSSSGRRRVQFWQLERLMLKTPGLLTAMAISMDEWLVPSSMRSSGFFSSLTNLVPRQLRVEYLINHPTFTLFGLILLGVISGVGVGRALQFVDLLGINGEMCWPVVLARGCGGAINVCSIVLLLLMSRPLLTWLRARGFGFYLPLDHHVAFHKAVAITLMVLATVHSVAHVINLEVNFAYEDNFALFVSINNLTDMLNPPVSNLTTLEWLFTTRPDNFGLIQGLSYPTGVLLALICVVMSMGSLGFVRAKGHFEVFYFSHLLYLLFFPLLVIHSPGYWGYLVIPGVLFMGGKAYSVINFMGGQTHVVCGVLLPSKVLQLVVRRREEFSFRCGDYVFLKVPHISAFEWHPFTISSAPEQADVVTLHIRAVGNWTKRLRNYFEKENERIRNENPTRINMEEIVDKKTSYDDSGRLANMARRVVFNNSSKVSSVTSSPATTTSYAYRRDGFSRVFGANEDLHHLYRYLNTRPLLVDRPLTRHSRRHQPLQVQMAGPYGAPSSDFFDAQHALIIATGIGVTPFASILQSIVRRRFVLAKSDSFNQSGSMFKPNLSFSSSSDSSSSLGRLRKVDFVWVNREQRSFEWFLQLLSQLEMDQTEQLGPDVDQHLLTIHLYITSMGKEHDYKAAVLNLALDLMHKKTKRDLMTGLKTRTHSGRPDWDALFRSVEQEKWGKVTVFYCGNNALAATVGDKCNKFGFSFKKEIF